MNVPTQELGYAGSSITFADPGYRERTNDWLVANHSEYAWGFSSSAYGGRATWPNLVRLQADNLVHDPDIFVFDIINNEDTDVDKATIEALIRRIWAANPATRLIAMNFFVVTDPEDNETIYTPANQGTMDALFALCAAYSIPIVDFHAAVIDEIEDNGADITDFLDGTVHPNNTGYALAASLLEAILPDGGAAKPGSYPARLYAETADYEQTPTIKNGTACDSRTGTWNDTGTRTESSAAGATITYSGTFRSFGCWRADDVEADVEISIDGGAFSVMRFYVNGIDLGSRAARTITVKVISDTVRIDEFWAI